MARNHNKPSSGKEIPHWKKALTVGVAGLAAFNLAGYMSGDRQEAPKPAPAASALETPGAATNTPESSPNSELVESVNESSLAAMSGILDILASDKSTTTEGYRGNMVGNKDEERPADMPEIAVGLDHSKSSIFVVLAQGYSDETGETTGGFDTPEGSEQFTSIEMQFSVGSGNPILGVNRQLTVEDFRGALAVGGDNGPQLISLKGQWYEGSSIPGVREFGISIVDGRVYAGVVEDGSGIILNPNKYTSDNAVAQRAVQILGAAVEDLREEAGIPK